jgi:hypothetical protein
MTDLFRSARGLAMLVVLASASSACLVVSVQPFFADDQVVSNPALVGSWTDPDEPSTVLAIEAGEWNSYRIAMTDRSGTQQFTGHLTRLGDREYMDVMPAHGFERGELFEPLHTAFAVEAKADSLTIRALSYEWFEAAKRAGRLAAVGAVFDARKNVLFTGTTEAVRAFVARQQRQDAMFAAPTTLVRKK